MNLKFEEIKNIVKEKNYVFFNKPWSINIIGVRDNNSSNKFDEFIYILWYDDKMRPNIESFNCTTKPGTYWLRKLMNKNGAAIIKEGQYRGVYKIGKHRGYEALQQIKPMKYFRDANKDDVHDYNGKIYEGNFRTNIHRAAMSGFSRFVNKWSAGCQVISGFCEKHYVSNWVRFLKVCKLSTSRYGNSLTYTLLNKNDFI